MSRTLTRNRRIPSVSRRTLLKGAALAALPALGASFLAPCRPAAAQAKPYAGRSITVWITNHIYARGLREILPEFESKTGIKVTMDLLNFDVHNQRADLQLSSGAGNVDVMNLTFIFAGRWIGANWCTDLTPLLNDPKMTRPDEVDVKDFIAGAISPFSRGEKIFGLPWVAETTMLMYRADIFKEKGIASPPKTYEEMTEIAKRIHSKDVAGNLSRGTNGLHWTWPNWLYAYGGKVFANPPADMTPQLNSKESVAGTKQFDLVSTDYGVPGSMAFTDSDAQAIFNQGRAAMMVDALGVLSAALDRKQSQVVDKVSFALPPAGPAGFKPQIAAHALQIPAGVKDKGPGWEFIKWATSKEILRKAAMEKSHLAVPRASVLSDSEYKKQFTWGGADMGALQTKVLDAAGAGYMTYRTVREFPQVGSRMVIALTEISSRQKSVERALDDLQKDVIGIVQQAGHKINESELPKR